MGYDGISIDLLSEKLIPFGALPEVIRTLPEPKKALFITLDDLPGRVNEIDNPDRAKVIDIVENQKRFDRLTHVLLDFQGSADASVVRVCFGPKEPDTTEVQYGGTDDEPSLRDKGIYDTFLTSNIFHVYASPRFDDRMVFDHAKTVAEKLYSSGELGNWGIVLGEVPYTHQDIYTGQEFLENFDSLVNAHGEVGEKA